MENKTENTRSYSPLSNDEETTLANLLAKKIANTVNNDDLSLVNASALIFQTFSTDLVLNVLRTHLGVELMVKYCLDETTSEGGKCGSFGDLVNKINKEVRDREVNEPNK